MKYACYILQSLPGMKTKDLIKELKKMGWQEDRQKGSIIIEIEQYETRSNH